MQSVIVHYQEIALKGKNRPWFVARLVRNLAQATSDLDIQTCACSWADRDRARARGAAGSCPGAAPRVFGVGNFAKAGRARSTSRPSPRNSRGSRRSTGRTFRVSARRADKRFPLTSPQIEREVGGRIKEARGWTVNLARPQFTIHVETLADEAFYFFGKDRGAGGLPVGVSGRVVCLLSGGIDSPVAAWRMMRRGCRVDFVHFHSYPVLSRARRKRRANWRAADPVSIPLAAAARPVRGCAAAGDSHRAAAAAGGALPSPDDADRRGNRAAARALALVTGEVVGQVASQTLENMNRITEVVGLPVLRPLVGMDKEEITAEAQRLGTFPIRSFPIRTAARCSRRSIRRRKRPPVDVERPRRRCRSPR